MKLSDFMDITQLQKVQDAFSEATGLAAVTIDTDGNYITRGSGFTDFCMKHTRGCEEGARRCQKCDAEGNGVYECHAGLMDFSIDITLNDEKLGAVVADRFFPMNPARKSSLRLQKSSESTLLLMSAPSKKCLCAPKKPSAPRQSF